MAFWAATMAMAVAIAVAVAMVVLWPSAGIVNGVLGGMAMAMAAGKVMTILELPALSLAAMVMWVTYFERAIDADGEQPGGIVELAEFAASRDLFV